MGVEKSIALFLIAIIIGVIVTNPGGVLGVFQGLTGLVRGTVGAFTNNQGFAARANTGVSSGWYNY